MDERNCYVIGRLRGKNQTLCVGITPNPPEGAYKHDIVCLGSIKTDEGEKCKPYHLSAMTPKEAIIVGVYLVRASILAEFKLQKEEEGFDWAINWEQFFQKKEKITDKNSLNEGKENG